MAIQTQIAIERAKDVIEKTVAYTQAEAAIEIRDELIRSGPNWTGWSRANWVIQENSPDRTPKESSGNPASAMADTDARARTIANKQTPSPNVYLTNNVPYVPFLNADGSPSGSVGPMWIEAAVQTALPRITAKVNTRVT